MRFSIANSVWNNTDLQGQFSKEYKARISEKYSATADEVSGKKLEKAVNAWVSKQTDGFIDNIVGDLSDIDAVLANALYLRSSWRDEFEASATHKGQFTTATGETVEKSFMYQTSHMLYNEDKKGNKLIAKELKGGILFVATLGDIKDIRASVMNATSFKTRLKLPKFDIESTFGNEMVSFVKARGGDLAFTNAADFNRMVENANWKIGDIVQKARFKAEESGVEAAAATVVMIRGAKAAIDREPYREFVADRPFRFYLFTDDTYELLFAGAINA